MRTIVVPRFGSLLGAALGGSHAGTSRRFRGAKLALASLRKSKWVFSRVDPVDILIWDAVGAEWLKACCPNVPTKVIPIRSEETNLHPRTLIKALSLVSRGYPLSRAYGIAMLAQAAPRLILTFSDNSTFHEYVSYLPGTTFIAVQNGWRFPQPEGSADPLPRGSRFKTELLCFGQNEIDEYVERDIHFASICSVGSLKNSLWLESQDESAPARDAPQFDIGLISQFRHRLQEAPFNLMSHQFQTCVIMLGEYISRHPEANVAVAMVYDPRTDPEQYLSEAAFICDALGSSVALLPRHSSVFNVYSLVDQSEVVVSSGSTAAVEALARGRKVLITGGFFIRDVDQMHTASAWNFGGEEYANFEERLDQLRAMDGEAFWNQVQSTVSYLMVDPRSFSAAEFLRTRIRACLDC